MLALQITSLKNFMNHLLAGNTFDIFLLEEASVTTANIYQIDGHLQKDFLSEDEMEERTACARDFALWSEMKGLCFQLIKGKRTPLAFKFVLRLQPAYLEQILAKANCSITASQINAFVLTVKYDGEKASLTTGCAYHTFLMSHEADEIWDRNLMQYLDKKEISYEKL